MKIIIVHQMGHVTHLVVKILLIVLKAILVMTLLILAHLLFKIVMVLTETVLEPVVRDICVLVMEFVILTDVLQIHNVLWVNIVLHGVSVWIKHVIWVVIPPQNTVHLILNVINSLAQKTMIAIQVMAVILIILVLVKIVPQQTSTVMWVLIALSQYVNIIPLLLFALVTKIVLAMKSAEKILIAYKKVSQVRYL
jgi:hypothetical protein